MSNSIPTFRAGAGEPGKLTRAVGTGDSAIRSVVELADGMLVVGGYTFNGSDYDFSLSRLFSDGRLDLSFGNAGSLVVPVGGSDDFGFGLATQPDGKVLLAGTTWNGSDYDVSVIRMLADGTLDSSFGTGGKLVVARSGHNSAYSVGVQPDGKIVLAGDDSSASGAAFSVLRLNTDGSLDTSFGSGGIVSMPVGLGASGDTFSLAFATLGRIVVASSSFNGTDYDFSVIRLLSDGTPDPTFGSGGKALIPVGAGNDFGYSLVLDEAGNILVAGTSQNASGDYDFSIVRLLPGGTPDPTFGNGGKLLVPVGSSSDFAFAVKIDGDGNILVSGTSENGSGSYDFSLIRLTSAGVLDETFGLAGKVQIPLGSNAYAYNALTQIDGKILLVGEATSAGLQQVGLIRLNADGTLDTTFNGETLGGTVYYVENAAAIRLDSSVAVYDAELSQLNGGLGNYDGASVTLSRSGGPNGDDVFSGLGNLSLVGNAGNVVLSGLVVGTFTHAGGELVISFNSNATQARLNETLSSLGYANSSDAPDANVQIDWLFSDGDAASPQVVTGTTYIEITAVNDLPDGAVTVSGTASMNAVLTAVQSVGDPDGLGTLTYAWLRNGVVIPGATGTTYTLGLMDVGNQIAARVTYVDAGGTTESVTSAPTTWVTLSTTPVAPAGLSLINGTSAANTLVGSNDALNYKITGLGGNDSLTAAGGNDWLDGGTGVDTMAGGAGDDTYVVDNVNDQVLEGLNGGIDTVLSSVNFTLGANIERLILTGSSGLTGTGNAMDNIVHGNSGANKLYGLDGNDVLMGGAGNDTLYGGNGNDTLVGGTGSDSMIGGAGDDTYVVDSTSGDKIVENANEGIDTVLSSVTFTLSTDVENLVLTGSGNINGTGNSLGNVITGNSGNNSINGGAGSDTMIGGAGNDTYVVDSGGDVVIEYAGEGIDTVQSSISYTLTANVEKLTLTGSSAINGTGNELDNVLTGNSGANILNGGDGNDTLIGGGGNDKLYGGAGNDSLDGGTGNDTMEGGSGDDIYKVDSSTDVVVELEGGGFDIVYSTKTFALSAYVEQLTLTGTANINGTGNAQDNILEGNSGNNSLSGGLGSDTLSGGAGNDTLNGGGGNDVLTGGTGVDIFVFDNLTSVDRIADFNVADDTIRLMKSAFTTLTTASALASSAFVTGTAAQTAAHRVIFDDTTGALYYDPDGIGGAAAFQFATIDLVGLVGALTNLDFAVV